VNWLAHLFLSQPQTEDRLGNILADLLKENDRKNLNRCFNQGIEYHRLVDKFTDSHPVVKHSKSIIIPQHRKYSGILVDIFYDHLLARNWNNYSQISLLEFKTEIYESFMKYLNELPENISKIIKQTIDEDWLGSYYNLSGIEQALLRIKKRLSKKLSEHFIVILAVQQLECYYEDFERDFNTFFPELINYVKSLGLKNNIIL
jgi:acyl carrier protein phosphodiesterase